MNGLISRLEEKKEDLSLSVQSTQVEHAVKGEGVSYSSREFYRLLEDGGWVFHEIYRRWFANDNIRKHMLLAALDNKKVNFRLTENRKFLPRNVLNHLDSYRLREFIDDQWSLRPKNPKKFGVVLDAESFLAWLKENYPLEETEQMNPVETTEEKTSNCSLVEILNSITPEMYPDGLKGQDKSAITKSLNTLKDQLPGAFKLCCSLVIEAMPCEDRKEHLKYTRDDVVQQAKERDIKRPMAQQIHKGLPAVMKK